MGLYVILLPGPHLSATSCLSTSAVSSCLGSSSTVLFCLCYDWSFWPSCLLQLIFNWLVDPHSGLCYYATLKKLASHPAMDLNYVLCIVVMPLSGSIMPKKYVSWIIIFAQSVMWNTLFCTLSHKIIAILSWPALWHAVKPNIFPLSCVNPGYFLVARYCDTLI